MSPHHDWRLLADAHKPTDPAALAAEIRHMADRGLKPFDISQTMRVDLGLVRAALTETIR